MNAATGSAIPSQPDDELLTEILARRRRRIPSLTIALTALLLVALAFVGGAEAQKHFGKAAGSNAGAGRGAGLQAGAFRRGFGGRGGRPTGTFPFAGGGATTGTVTLIKGSTLYVTDSAGNTTLVRTSPASRVTKTVASSLKSIRPGSVVTVLGAKAKDGSVTASSISAGNGG